MKTAKLIQLGMVFGLGIVLLAGCSSPSKKHGATGGDADMSGLPGGTDTVGGIAANARPDGVNPDTDVDYSILEAQTVYFDFDSTTVRASERSKLAELAAWLKDNPGKRVMLAGHTDIRGTPEYNRGLGERRGLAVREYLVGLGVDQGRLFTISYGSERPAVQGSDDAAYAKNRRVAPGVITK
jgi:peptidoglycan-associated lipoprotein